MSIEVGYNSLTVSFERKKLIKSILVEDKVHNDELKQIECANNYLVDELILM